MRRALAAAAVVVCTACLDFQGALGKCVDAGLCSMGGGGGSTGGGGTVGGGTGGAGGGVAVQGALVIDAPGGASFGSVPTDDAGVLSFELRNVGAVDVLNVLVQTSNPTEFSLSPPGPCSSVGVDASCSFQVVFAPSLPGSRMATLSAAGMPSAVAVDRQLSGTGISPAPNFSLSPPLVMDFGEVAQRMNQPFSGTRSLGVTNVGQPTLTGISVIVSGPGFALVNDLCTGRALGSGISCFVDVLFAPAFGTTGRFTGSAAVTISSPTLLPTRSIQLTADVHNEWPLNVVISGTGRVVSADGGLDCPGRCTEQVRMGQSRQLTATAVAPVGLGSWDGGGCSGNGSCSAMVSGPTTVTADFRHRLRAFVSKRPHDGDFGPGGAAGVDRFCVAEAIDAGLASDGGNYLALLLTGPDPLARFAGNRGWVRVDDQPLANDVSDIAAGRVLYPFNLDQDGQRASAFVWVGSDAGGDCTNWTSNMGGGAIGASFTVGPSMTRFATGGCVNATQGVYCLEIGSLALPHQPLLVPAGGRRAFVSGAEVNGLLSRAQLDAVCQQEATAELASPGTFVALLSSQTVSAASRFNLDAGTWYRVDGVRLFAAAAELGSAMPLMGSGLNVQADGGHYLGPLYGAPVWTGGHPTGVPAGFSCPAWEGLGGNGNGTRGSAVTFGQTYWFEGASQPNCATGLAHVYCFEQ